MGNTRAFWGGNYPGPRNWECHCLHFPCTWMVGRSSDQVRWPTRKTAVAHPQLPLPQLDPAGTGEHHRMSTRDPFTSRLIQRLQQGASVCAHRAACANEVPLPGDSKELAKHCGMACRAALSRDNGVLLHTCGAVPPRETAKLAKPCGTHIGLPCAE